MQSRIEALRPIVSAMTPVGTSNTIWLTVKMALTSMTSNRLRPPSRIRKIVLIAQMSDAANVNTSVIVRYAPMMRRGVYSDLLNSLLSAHQAC